MLNRLGALARYDKLVAKRTALQPVKDSPSRPPFGGLVVRPLSSDSATAAKTAAPKHDKRLPAALSQEMNDDALYVERVKQRQDDLEKYRHAIRTEHDKTKHNAVKRDFVEGHREYVKTFFASKQRARENEVVAQYLVWLGDCGYIEHSKVNYLQEFIDTFWLAHRSGFNHTPQHFKHDLQTIFARTIYEWSMHVWKNEESPLPYLDEAVNALKERKITIPAQAAGELMRLKGDVILKYGDYPCDNPDNIKKLAVAEMARQTDAKKAFQTALAYNSKVRVAQRLEDCEREITNASRIIADEPTVTDDERLAEYRKQMRDAYAEASERGDPAAPLYLFLSNFDPSDKMSAGEFLAEVASEKTRTAAQLKDLFRRMETGKQPLSEAEIDELVNIQMSTPASE